jgi:endonuclease/exonuclease/phosphatase family metal-dependent hydrolase
MTLKVLTLNIWHDQSPWSERLVLLRRWMDRLDPDIIAFQEVLVGDGVDQVREILGRRREEGAEKGDEGAGNEAADAGGYYLDYGPAMTLPDRKHLQFGNAIASRWPILDREEIRLADRGDWESRAALSVTIDSPHGPIGFTCTHLHWQFNHGFVREKQVELLAERAWKRRPENGFPPIIAGDFNAEPDSDEIRFMTGRHSLAGRSVAFLDAWEVAGDSSLAGEAGRGITWSNRNAYARVEYEPCRRIDYLFVGLPGRKGEGWVEQCRVVCDEEEDGAWPTDHFGVYAELRTGTEAKR